MSWFGRIRLPWTAALIAALSWLLCAGAFAALAWTERYPRQFLAHFVSEPIPSGVWNLPWPWSLLVPFASTLVVFLVYLLLAGPLATGPAGSRGARFLALWFVAVAAGFLASLPFALTAVITEFPPSRAAFLLDPAGDWMLRSGYWGILWGWIPALAATFQLRARAGVPAAAPAEPRTGHPRRTRLVLAAIVVVALVASGVTVGVGGRVARLEAAALSAIDEGHTIGAFPDPDAEVIPPEDTAPAGDIDPTWCSPDEAVLLLGGKDAATGHRVLTIWASNFTDAPCVLDGYPDLAFADENGSELEVSVTPGGSFLTEDAGASPIIVPAGGYAVTRLGWDAMATAGELVVYELHAALYPGLTRGSWPITLDIVAGGEVAVTAWTLDAAGPGTP